MPSEDEWVSRCALRIAEIDPQMGADEAQQLARELRAFERTALMDPAAAVDFVVSEMNRPGGRFERRIKPRGGDAG